MRAIFAICLPAFCCFGILLTGFAQNEVLPVKGKLLYKNNLSGPADVKEWKMEGPGVVEFRDKWMHMYSPNEEWHHVFWCPRNFPGSFIAEWEMQNLNPAGGLCIVFFAAKGTKGEDVLDPVLPERDGTFRQYTSERLNSYHISYYANNPNNTEREAAHLRKNNMFEIVQKGPEGIPKSSTEIHKIRLIKDSARIVFFVDDKKIIDWTDDGKSLGPVYQDGKIGFRQMMWTNFRYRNFKVWGIKPK